MVEQKHDFDDVAQYASTGDSQAFARIVRRHIDMVYSAALRRTSDRHLADDITQSTFLVLAQQAKSLRPGVHLAAWLLRVTRYTASNAVRLKNRRARYERKAGQAVAAKETQAAPDDLWAAIAPKLDDAVLSLRETDRQIVVLRFFENCSMVQAAKNLGISEDAARQRLSRAIARLRGILAGDGVTALSITELTRMLGQQVPSMAPSHLAAAVTAAHAVAPTAKVAAIAKVAGTMLGVPRLLSIPSTIAATLIVALGIGVAVQLRAPANTVAAQTPATAPTSAPAIIEPVIVSRDAHPVAEEMYTILDAAKTFASEHARDGRPQWPNTLTELEPLLLNQDVHLDHYLYTFPANLEKPDFSEIALLELNPQDRAPLGKFIGGQFLGTGDGVVLYTPSLYWTRQPPGTPDLLLLAVCEPESTFISGVLGTFPDPHDLTGRRRVAVGRSIWMSGPCFESAKVVPASKNAFNVVLACKDQYKAMLRSHTTNFKGRRMAIVLLDSGRYDLLTAPVITEPMTDAFPIDRQFTREQADALAARINRVLGALPK
jgi:RNA polymerase sigma factor (sigma-70 family)